MKVTFGLYLDSRQGPLLSPCFNAPVLGRMGMLSLLELQLGLAGPPVARAQRVAAYLGALRKADTGSRFYSKSLAVDEMGVASELLSWRDEWLLAGWSGSADVDGPTRVLDMAAVEAAAAGRVATGEGERLQRVLAALETRRTTISEVRLLDERLRLPTRWQEVMGRLPVKDDSALVSRAENPWSMLGRLQRAAVAATESGKVDALAKDSDDGSVLVLQAESIDGAAHWLALEQPEVGTRQLLVCEQQGVALDDMFHALGEPVCGFDSPSAHRPALQALPLAMELLWKPVDVHRVLEFLSHPYGPFSRKTRGILARAYSTQPGYGAEEWDNAKQTIKGFDGGDGLLAHVKFWFEGERWDRGQGAPLSVVQECIDRMAKALRHLMEAPRDDILAIAGGIAQAQAMTDALAELKAQGVERLTPRHLEQLVAQATVSGAGNPYAQPEVGCRRSAVKCSSAVVEPAQEVVWWMPSRPALPKQHPWSIAEMHALQMAGATLTDTAVELRALARDWLRPLLAAEQRFILVLPPSSSEEHPVWLLLRRLLPHLVVRSVATELASSTRCESVQDNALPRLARELTIAAELGSRKARQSFSSLEELFNNPAVAVLKDCANLRGTLAAVVADERRLMGTLAHRLVEKLFSAPGAIGWEAARVRAWVDVHADTLIEGEGATLLMRGSGITLHRFKNVVRDGTLALVAHLQSAGALGVKAEVPLEGSLFGVPVVGKADLIVELPESRFALLDLKWSGQKRYRERLESGTHLQLAVYGALAEQTYGRLPVELAFFIFDSRTMLATSAIVFPNALVCEPPAGSTVEQLISCAHASWQWRTQQLAQGKIDVVDVRLAELDDFQGPPGTLPVRGGGPWNADYVALLGWEVDA